MKTKLPVLILAILMLTGCYVSSVTTITKKETPKKGKIFLVSKIDHRNSEYIKSLCDNLNQKLTENGYIVTEYVSEKYDSLYFSKVLETENPNNVLLIFPENKYKFFSSGFVELTYSIELVKREKSINNTIFDGFIKIAYREDKRNSVINKSTDEIFKSVFQQEQATY